MRRWIAAAMLGGVLGAGMGVGAESRFFRILASEPIEITGIADGVVTWNQPEGVEVTVEVTEDLLNLAGWRRYTEIPGGELRGSVRVMDRHTPPGMVLIPGGRNSGTDPFEFIGDYSLYVASFFMDTREVSKETWDSVYQWAVTNGYHFANAGEAKAPGHPVHSISIYDMMKWCNARSEQAGRTPVYYTHEGEVFRTGEFHPEMRIEESGYRLPTQSEWEYAARGGLTGKRYPWGDTIHHDQANYYSESHTYEYDLSPKGARYHPDFWVDPMPYTSPTGSFAPNGYGLYDMTGNVKEVCHGTVSCDMKWRGGSWYNIPSNVGCGFSGALTVQPSNQLGFRTVMTMEPPVSSTPVLFLSGDLAFGETDVGHIQRRVLKLINEGNGVLTVTRIDYPEGFSGVGSDIEVAAGGCRIVEVFFAPERTGVYEGTITVDSNATSGDSSIGVSGSGRPPAPAGMVSIPGGTNAGTDPDFEYSLTVEAFYMDRTPITKAQWDEVYTWATHADRGENGYSFGNAGSGKAADHPVVNVNWYDAVKWCNARSEKEGRSPVYSVGGGSPQAVYRSGQPTHTDVVQDPTVDGYRLPTVAEHQYASRGGLVGKRFPWGDTITHSQANYYSHSSYSYDISETRGYHPDTSPAIHTLAVDWFSGNGYGLYDMAGNVRQWCWDPSGSNRALRGGSWHNFDGANNLRCGHVDWASPTGTGRDTYGFRTVCR